MLNSAGYINRSDKLGECDTFPAVDVGDGQELGVVGRYGVPVAINFPVILLLRHKKEGLENGTLVRLTNERPNSASIEIASLPVSSC